jgi:hypothetical protein
MERVTLQQWNDLMRHAGEDKQHRLRDARRAGGIEIVGLSTTKDAVVKRLKRREHWRLHGTK